MGGGGVYSPPDKQYTYMGSGERVKGGGGGGCGAATLLKQTPVCIRWIGSFQTPRRKTDVKR